MKKYFADTYFFAALLNPRDSGHICTRDLLAELLKKNSLVVTTGFVLMELGNALSATQARGTFSEFLQTLKQLCFRMIPASQRLLEKGLHLYCSRMDKEWSVVDCISFIVMKEQRIQVALTADHHFQQAGFQCLTQ